MSGRKRSARPQGGHVEPVEIELARLDATGEATAMLADGRTVRVPGALPGERALVRLEPSRTSSCRAGLVAIRRPSAARLEPPCPFAQRCGGCELMHVAPTERPALLSEALARFLPRSWGEAALAPRWHAPGPALQYRNRARLAVRADLRRAVVGYRGARSHAIAAIDSCLVLRPELQPIVGELATWLAHSRGEGEAEVALGREGRRVCELCWRGELDAGAIATAHRWVADGIWAGARVWLEGARAPVAVGDARPWVVAADDLPLTFAPGGFAQPSVEGGNALARLVAERARGCEGRLVELFAGSGTLSVLLAPLGAPFVAVEQDEAAVAELRHNLALRGHAPRLRVQDANLFDLPRPTDTVVLDPPRIGAAGAISRILRARPRRVVYVACHPPSVVRDMNVLVTGGYAVTAVDVLDLFPQTHHVEVVVTAERARPAARRSAGC